MADHSAFARLSDSPRTLRAAGVDSTVRHDTAALARAHSVIQLMIAPTASSIEVIPVTVGDLALDSDSGTVTGILSSPRPLTFTPQFVHTNKGRARVNRDGSITYTPGAAARRAASRIGAAYRHHDRDIVSIDAVDSDGARVSAQATIAILGF
ncbi:hypothetical protein BVC93_29135 [Mycobacterium sp. MS1601]|uniref:hypothetical protein n=1 Tax=Mycobacterium sp. MS1601 TaxID=1936029 RepID=UPI0009790B3F|nr:hypothetical protein [Mycobacterium sp. MS1601]AQA05762.1 hypothetical protein BVC93_29135 [Mycobacterium sp. MS1601]